MQVQFKKSKLVVIVAGILLGSIFAMAEGDVPREQVREAMHECHEAAGLPRPERGQRPQAPTEEQRALVAACMKEKGIEMPPCHGGHPSEREGASAQ